MLQWLWILTKGFIFRVEGIAGALSFGWFVVKMGSG